MVVGLFLYIDIASTRHTTSLYKFICENEKDFKYTNNIGVLGYKPATTPTSRSTSTPWIRFIGSTSKDVSRT